MKTQSLLLSLFVLLFCSASGCVTMQKKDSVAGPWTIEATEELRATWNTLEKAIEQEDWSQALTQCTKETRKQAALHKGSMPAFFKPLHDLRIAFLMFPPDYSKEEQWLAIRFWLTDDALPPYVPFLKEEGHWKFRIPRKR